MRDIKIDVKNKLQEFGIRPSVYRIAILEHLMRYPLHPTADMIFNDLDDAIPTLSKTTVYNTLNLFLEQGLIQSLSIDEKNERYDVNLSKHAHFKCKGCESIRDLVIDGLDLVHVKNLDHCVVTGLQFYFVGYCETCRKELEININ
jgi:Fe2+ or Zn2+ uptake regulation protein